MLAALRNPLFRSSYALVANTAGTTAVGVAYWAVAAHLFSRQAVGQASALVSALILMSSLAQLNLTSTLPRFLPQAGRRAGRLIGYGYGITTAAALLAGVAFVIVVPELSAQWHFLGTSWPLRIAFVAAAVAWGIFALQDAALLGLRRAMVVPVENTIYGVAKLVMLIAIASLLPATGIFMSWILPLAIVVPVVNWLIFGRYLATREGAAVAATVHPREVIRFTSLDYLGSLLGQAYASLLPLLVLSLLGAAANASFYIAWTISAGLVMVAGNFSASLLSEASAAPDRLGELTRGVLARSLLVTVTGAAVLWLAAGPILSIYGHRYAIHASLLLGLLAAGTVPNGLLAIAFALDRIAGQLGRAAWSRLSLAVLILGGSWLLLRRAGIDGVGLAWLGANTVVALARIPTIVSAARTRERADRRAQRAAAAPGPVAEPESRPAGRHRQPRG
jgi:O-antigen/teichoic acid export membrane protein